MPKNKMEKISKEAFTQISGKKESRNLSRSKKLKKDDEVEISYFFHGVKKFFVGLVTKVIEKGRGTRFIYIKDPEGKYMNEMKTAYDYTIGIYNSHTISFMVKDGAIRPVPFVLSP